MNDSDRLDSSPRPRISKLAVAAVVVSLVGLVDSIYLTVHHYTAEPVPCTLLEGCEQVLTSSYAEIAGFPLAAFGAAAYFVAFSLALFTTFGDHRTWRIFGAHTIVMAIVSAWLVYLQAVVIGAFCQFCLLSAVTTFTLLIIFIASLFIGRDRSRVNGTESNDS